MKVFARFKNETWCKDIAYLGKLPKEIKGVKYLLVRQDLFETTVDGNGMKQKNPQKRLKLFK